jgi:hypothetical protein
MLSITKITKSGTLGGSVNMNKLGRMIRRRPWPTLRNNPGLYVTKIRNMETIRQVRRHQTEDLNPAPPNTLHKCYAFNRCVPSGKKYNG